MLRPMIERYLETNGIPYRLLPRVPDEALEAEGESPDAVQVVRAKGVLVEVDSGEEVICVIPQGAEVDLDALTDVLRAEDAVVCEVGRLIELFPGCEIGAAPPFAGLWGVPVLVDTEVELSDRLLIPAGDFEQELEIRTTDYLYVEGAMVAAIASYPGEPWKHAMPAAAFTPSAQQQEEGERPHAEPPPPPGEER